jgi:predicted RNA polymerase sigma factor
MESTESSHRAVEAVARESYGRLVAYLSSRTRDPAGAEDALADALLAALQTWPRTGIPANPHAWLLTAGRHRLTDEARHRQVRAQNAHLIAAMDEGFQELDAGSAVSDERLGLLLVCAHPSIDPGVHTPLMLQTVLGLDAASIGRAFLVAPETMGQRLVRAKRKIRRARIRFQIPDATELPKRLGAVLNALYAGFSHSWDDAAGSEVRSRGLAEEGLWLVRLMVSQLPEEPEVRGLLALMLYCESRRAARRNAEGQYVPLGDQDCGLWNWQLIDEAERELARAAGASRVGRFQLEAAIQSVHAQRGRTGRTAWEAIQVFYDQLSRECPTAGVAVGRAAAHAEVDGAAVGLSLLDQIPTGTVLAYQPYWALRAHLLARLGRAPAARAAFDRAFAFVAR